MAKKVPTKKNERSLEQLEKDLLQDKGEGFILRASDIGVTERIPTGLMSIDRILSGGIPRGRLTEIFGPEMASKSLLLLTTIASAQQMGGVCVYIDTEKSFDPIWAAKNGVNIEELRIIEPSCGEEAWDLVENYLATGEVDVVGLDSIANCVPRAELEGVIGQASIGLAARMNAQAMRIISSHFGSSKIKNARTALIAINQMRKNISTGPFMGNPNTTTGGGAIPYYASLRIELRRIGWVKRGEAVVGGNFRCRVIKAKLTGVKPYATTLFEVDFDHGMDIAKDLLVYATMEGLVDKSGNWYTIGEERFNGEGQVKQYMRDHPELMEEWREKLTI